VKCEKGLIIGTDLKLKNCSKLISDSNVQTTSHFF
jgi:hypothetical protein